MWSRSQTTKLVIMCSSEKWCSIFIIWVLQIISLTAPRQVGEAKVDDLRETTWPSAKRI